MSMFKGLVHGEINPDRKITDKVDCTGSETGLEKCRIRYKTRTSTCKPEESIVAITCIHDSYALCDENEVPWSQSCYSVHFNR